MKAAHFLFFCLFAFSVAVQYNDPDPLRWMLLYGAAAIASLLAVFHRGHILFSALVVVVSLLWAAFIGWHLVAPKWTSLFDEFKMTDPSIEEPREFFGLLIAASWMAVIALQQRKKTTRTSR